MPKNRERPRFEIVRTIGDPDEFADVLEETVSRKIAIDAGGRTYYSAIIVAKA